MDAAATWMPYCGAGPGPAEWFLRWNLDPVLLGAMAVALVAGWRCARSRMGLHWGAAALVAVLFVSPFCALGSSLFAVRVVHHVILSLVLAPLLVAAMGLHERRLGVSLATATALQAVVFWAWHAPAMYAAALSSDAIFWLMQLSITGSAVLWWARLHQSATPGTIAALLATMVQMGALGALLTFSTRSYYAPHALTTQMRGWSPLEDQQIAGLIMWAPAAALYLAAAMIVLYRSIGSEHPARAAA